MKKSPTNLIAAKRIAVAVATVFATMSVPAFAADDLKGLMDLLLKKGVITQQEYEANLQAAQDAAENKAFKEKRIDDDVAKLNKLAEKNKDTGSVMKSGFGMQSADGKTTIQLMGRLHMDYRDYSPSFATGSSTDSYQNKLDIRRARLGVKGKIQNDFKYEIQGTYGGGGVDTEGLGEKNTILDIAFVDYEVNPALQFRFGKFKMPYSLEQLTSSNNIDFMERSMANQVEGEIVPSKETGAMVFGSPISGVTYGLALSKGRDNKSAAVDSPDFVGRVTANVAELLGNKEFVTHLGLGYSTGEIAAMTPGSKATEARGATIFTSAGGGVTAGSTRTRIGLEGAIAYGPLKIQGETFDTNYAPVGTADKSIKVYYTEALYNLTGESHNYSNSAGTFGWIKPKSAFTNNGGLGAWQVGVRYTKLDATDFTASSTTTNKANALTFGINWILNENLRFMLNYVDTKFSTPVGAVGSKVDGEKAIMMRTQIWF